MLREITSARNKPGAELRRWFQDDYFDLFVWFAPEGGITGFQLAYSRSRQERVLTWKMETGFRHHRVEEVRSLGGVAATPVMVDDGTFPVYRVAEKFESACADMVPEISGLVIAKLREYPRVLFGPMRKPRRKKRPPHAPRTGLTP